MADTDAPELPVSSGPLAYTCPTNRTTLPHLSPPPHHDFGGQFGQHVRDSISHFSGGGGGMTGGKPDPGESVGMFGDSR